MISGIPSPAEGDESTAIMTDTTTIPTISSLPDGDASSPDPTNITELSRGVDIPSTITPDVISEPAEIGLTEPIVGPQTKGTPVGSHLSPYERVLALLADPDPNKDIFRMDLGSFVIFFGRMIEKLLHRGYYFDQFRCSLARHMTMIRLEGYPELDDSFTADFVSLECELRELGELKASGASSFVSSQLEHRLTQWHDLRSSIGSELQSHESSIAQMMASLAKKDTNRVELLTSLEPNHEEVARLKKALKYAEESGAIIADELASLESSRG
ncbi:uncharacterized protein LOC109822059 isoform X2 [Asparagus officinalis]|uniref:uncharacterized protein LOC109822059 isoform X2 n=1 Tax=Asparagus officinalis TaxID=4686 RepID=UPI00098E5FCC|nr:uncharacterized protein LOC109822059 isoform X2 [Asparagus officinalis]